MRLLKRNGDKLVFAVANETEFTTPYAILSHTWGEEHEEIRYEDVLAGKTNDKIEFTLDRAARDGYEYIWVDTCCIDKRNNTELGESINLMWKWYANSAVCYAYLRGPLPGNRWFTRGWTLQELIAPKQVVFFSDEQRLGSRVELIAELHSETGIPQRVLSREVSMTAVPMAERYRWAARRETKKAEDRIYCLLGLLDVALPLNYGAGYEDAQSSLLDKVDQRYGQRAGNALRVAMHKAVPFEAFSCVSLDQLVSWLHFDNMHSRRDSITRPVRGTCHWLLKHPDFSTWLQHSIGVKTKTAGFLWIKGHPGAGKSTLMKFADESTKDQGTLQLSFYFNARGALLERSVNGLFRSLLTQLYHSERDLWVSGCIFLRRRITTSSLLLRSEPTTPLLQELLSLAVQQLQGRRVRCFIDALDECDIEEIRSMVSFLHDLSYSPSSEPYFFICFASRYYPTLSIRHAVDLRLDLQRHQIQAVEDYVKRQLNVADDHFGRSLLENVVGKARGVFMWAVLVVKLLNDELDKGRIHKLPALIASLPSELDDIYRRLAREHEDADTFCLCTQLIYLSDPPLTGLELYYTVLFGLGELPADVSQHSIPSDADLKRFTSSSSRGCAELVPGNPDTVQFVHESVRDFLGDGGGLAMLVPPSTAGPVASSHDQIKQILVRYLDTISVRYQDDQRIRLAQDRVLDLPPYPFQLRKWSVQNGLPLLSLVSTGIIHHAEQSSVVICQDLFLRTLDWHGLAAVVALDSHPLRPLLTGSRGAPPYPIGLLASQSAHRLMKQLIKLEGASGTQLSDTMLALQGRMNIIALKQSCPDIESHEQLGRIVRKELTDSELLISLPGMINKLVNAGHSRR